MTRPLGNNPLAIHDKVLTTAILFDTGFKGWLRSPSRSGNQSVLRPEPGLTIGVNQCYVSPPSLDAHKIPIP